MSWVGRVIGGVAIFDVLCGVVLWLTGKKDSQPAPERAPVPMPEHWAPVYINGED